MFPQKKNAVGERSAPAGPQKKKGKKKDISEFAIHHHEIKLYGDA